MRALVRALLGSPPSDLVAESPIDAAILGGVRASTVGAAFLDGYRAALRALVPELPAHRVICLAASEEAGAHPRAIATRLEPEGKGFVLSGRKQWVTGGPQADELLVVASTGTDEQGRNRLRVVRVDAHAPGVSIEPMPETRFTPEIAHAVVRLDRVRVDADALLPGDGYERYLKPFRTVEDVHVYAAVLAWVLAVARRSGWPAQAREQLVALLVALHALAHADPSAPETHVALAGTLELGRELLERTHEHWALTDPETRERWQRDRPLLGVAGRSRAQRAQAAWKVLGR